MPRHTRAALLIVLPFALLACAISAYDQWQQLRNEAIQLRTQGNSAGSLEAAKQAMSVASSLDESRRADALNATFTLLPDEVACSYREFYKLPCTSTPTPLPTSTPLPASTPTRAILATPGSVAYLDAVRGFQDLRFGAGLDEYRKDTSGYDRPEKDSYGDTSLRVQRHVGSIENDVHLIFHEDLGLYRIQIRLQFYCPPEVENAIQVAWGTPQRRYPAQTQASVGEIWEWLGRSVRARYFKGHLTHEMGLSYAQVLGSNYDPANPMEDCFIDMNTLEYERIAAERQAKADAAERERKRNEQQKAIEDFIPH
ncbi:MAG: hypothetical protein ACHQ9S_16890 [Candidatus Binatia bacterium]